MRSHQPTTQQTTFGRQEIAQEHQQYIQPLPPQATNLETRKGRKTSIVPKGSLANYLDWVESMGMDRAKGLEYVANLGLSNLKTDIINKGGYQ